MINTKNKSLIIGMVVFLSSMDSYAWTAPQRWQSVGPKGVAIESDYSFKMSLNSPDTLYLRTGKTLLKSIDGSTHWNVVERERNENIFGELLIDPINPQILFSLLQPKINLSAIPPSLSRSLDGGLHWDQYYSSRISSYTPEPFFMLNRFGFPQLINESDEGKSILTSNDGGEHWSAINDSLNTDIRVMAVASNNADVWYGKSHHFSPLGILTSVEHLHQSTDAGKTWVKVAKTEGVKLKKLQIHPMDSHLLFATILTDFIEFIARSQDGGKTWTVMKTPKNDYLFDSIHINGGEISTLYATVHQPHQDSSEIVIAKSTDGGDNWRIKRTGFSSKNNDTKRMFFPHPNPNPSRLIVHPKHNQTLFLATLSHGILQSITGGDNWQANPMDIKHVGGHLVVAKNDAALMYLASGTGHYKSVNAGGNWEKFDVNQSNELCQAFSINPSVHSEVLCLAADKLYKSTDSGNQWILINTFDTTTLHTTEERPSISYSSDGRVIYANHVNGVSKSTDSGSTWTKTNISQAKAHIVRWLATDPIKSHIVYALIDEPFVDKRAVLYKSMDKGIHWEKKISERYLQLAIDPTRSDRLIQWAGYYSNISLSEDGGDSWKNLAVPPTARSEMVVSFNPKNPNGLFLLNTNGVFETEDLENWTLIKKGVRGSFSASSDDIYLVSPNSVLRLENFVMSEEAKGCLFLWAEQKYPQLFNPATAQTQVSDDYTYRYYSQSNTTLGFFQDKSIHLLQPSVSGEVQDVGLIESYQNISACH